MADNPFASALDALFSGMDKFVTTKTVVGEAVMQLFCRWWMFPAGWLRGHLPTRGKIRITVQGE